MGSKKELRKLKQRVRAIELRLLNLEPTPRIRNAELPGLLPGPPVDDELDQFRGADG